MKVRIYEDEIYPAWLMSENYGTEVEVPVEQFERWVATRAAFFSAQAEMEDAYKAHEAAHAV